MRIVVYHLYSSMEQSRLRIIDAKLLKKLGYKGETNGYYIKGVPVFPSPTDKWNEKGPQFVAMPDSHQAIEFLFKNKGVFITVKVDVNNEDLKIKFRPVIYMTRNRRITYNYELESNESLEKAYAIAVSEALKALSKM